ncbi:MAG: cob(I)yrinic acid a,c-diamide adenosyltransferase [Chloroflexota bacterium]|nr:cob(I)yrinic acid a,c-diamide adenosyltransferase [Chloroflexota bacterium]
MPHYTRSGDDGSTTLWGGGRIAKDHPQPEAYGAIDEASAALGLGRALSRDSRTREIAIEIQRRLYLIMAELAVAPEKPIPEDFTTQVDDVDQLEAWAEELERLAPPPNEFVLPGGSPGSAALDLARTTIRRAEREVVRLRGHGHPVNEETIRYLNRASSVLFDLARYEEQQAGVDAIRSRPTTPSDVAAQ